ncbi:hypothetical protein [Antrihabitans cavernicola]|uniref:DUF3558 domain-containing protein n=1 Tax=Antrihabitans cavernicola TaxID=2495913 RepID=A0A5A7SAU4_9NOCA|nr:hypothetical protein [Spelaeibacter cavernicola]KAA0021341.1 hypothetical protein FOY51_19020 [Spelaeibacter cavernicola]
MALGNRISQGVAAAIVIAAFPLLAACGGSSTDGNAQSAADSIASGSDMGLDFTTPNGASSAAANVDVCSLLHEDDAYAVADKSGLAGGKAAGATYKLTSTKVDYDPSIQQYSPKSGCRFSFDATGSDGDTNFVGAVVIETSPASDFDLYAGNGKPIAGLGDEAVDSAGVTYVKVGDVMFQSGEDSFTNDFVTDLYRKMVPNMK